MELQSDGSYVAYADISFLPDRYGYVSIYVLCESGSTHNLKYLYGDLAISNLPDLDEYLAELAELDHHTIIIAARDEASCRLTESNRASLSALGLEADLGYRNSYYAVISPECVIEELSDDSSLEYSGFLSDGESLYVHSAGYDYGNTCSIMIDDVEYANKSTGLNFAIYDNESHRVVNRSSFNTYSGVRTLPLAEGFSISSSNTFVEYLPETNSLIINVSNIGDTSGKIESVNAEIWSGTQEKQFLPLTQDTDGVWSAAIDVSLIPSGTLHININAIDSNAVQYRLNYISGSYDDLKYAPAE